VVSCGCLADWTKCQEKIWLICSAENVVFVRTAGAGFGFAACCGLFKDVIDIAGI
jgi:hypothetical protein